MTVDKKIVIKNILVAAIICTASCGAITGAPLGTGPFPPEFALPLPAGIFLFLPALVTLVSAGRRGVLH
jgi:hypothetical protein